MRILELRAGNCVFPIDVLLGEMLMYSDFGLMGCGVLLVPKLMLVDLILPRYFASAISLILPWPLTTEFPLISLCFLSYSRIYNLISSNNLSWRSW